MNTLTVGKFHKLIVNQHYNTIIDIDGYKDPENILYSEQIDVIITEPFLILEIKEFKTAYIDKTYNKTMEPWIKVLVPNKNIVCWVEKEKLTMWTRERNASIVKL